MLKLQVRARGQTVPFWLFGTMLTLALTLFVVNYTNTIRWHIRAQNAADTAAMATVAVDANLNNQRTMALYALAIDEYRIRSIVQSMINAANSVGGCNPHLDDTGVDCDNAYDQEPEIYDKAVGEFATNLTYLKKLGSAAPPAALPLPNGPGGTPPPLPSAPAGSSAPAAFSLVASESNCWDAGTGTRVFDCAFGYAANPDLSQTGFGSNEYVDIVACRYVTQTGSKFFSGPAQFTAAGRAAATLRGVTTTIHPGSDTDPDATPGPGSSTAPPYQPIESCPPDIAKNGSEPCDLSLGWMATQPYVVDYSSLTISATFYVPEPTKPVGALKSALCKQG